MRNLKIILIAAITTAFMNSHSFAQNSVNQGDIIVDGFYGYPYFNGALLKAVSVNTDKVHNLNHLGGKVEYMVSEKVGLGVEFTYADASVKFQSDSTKLWYTAGISKYRILGKFNYHFATTANLDPYFTVGAGLKHTNVYDNEPGGGKLNVNLIPVAVRFSIGVRYFFTDYIGACAEVGLGGPMMQVGITAKF